MIIFQAERHFPFTRHQSMWSPCLSGKLLFFHKILSNTNIKNIVFPSIPVLEFSFFLLCLKLDCTHFYISKEIASVSCWPFPFSPSWHWILLSCWTHAAHIKALPDSPFSLFYITCSLFYLFVSFIFFAISLLQGLALPSFLEDGSLLYFFCFFSPLF